MESNSSLIYLDTAGQIRSVDIQSFVSVRTFARGRVWWEALDRHQAANLDAVAYISHRSSDRWIFSVPEEYPSLEKLKRFETFEEAYGELVAFRYRWLRDLAKPPAQPVSSKVPAKPAPYRFRGEPDIEKLIEDNPGEPYILVRDESSRSCPWRVLDVKLREFFYYESQEFALRHGWYKVYPGAFRSEKKEKG